MADYSSNNMIHSMVLNSITLTSEEILSLVKGIQANPDDTMLQDALVSAYLRTIEKCLFFLGGEKVSFKSDIYSDLMTVGMCAVIVAAKEYDITRGTKFNTFAISKIKFAMQEERKAIYGWNHKAVREHKVLSYEKLMEDMGDYIEAETHPECDSKKYFEAKATSAKYYDADTEADYNRMLNGDFTEQIVNTHAVSEILKQVEELSPFKANVIKIAFDAPQGKECGAVAKALNITKGEAKKLIQGIIDELRAVCDVA